LQRIFVIIFIFFFSQEASSQYYIKGEIKNEKEEAVQNVKIFMPSKKAIFYSGISGGFGIPSSNLYDSLIISHEGYETQAIKIKATEYQKIILKVFPASKNIYKPKLISLTKGQKGTVYPAAYFESESYSNLAENDFIKAGESNKTSFSMRIDKASYSNIRRFINQDMKVPPDAVRIDEMLNYFNFKYQQPAENETFRISSRITDCPWNVDHKLLFLNLSAKKINLDKVPRSNFVFLIDVSGSMDLPNRLPLLKEAFQLLVKNLREKDTVSIVTYGGSVGIWLPPTSGKEKQIISQSLEKLTASGDTPGEAAIRTAYQLAKRTFIKDGNNRIILATDGDFNIGQTTEQELEELIAREKQSGVYLTCLGMGMGNYKDSKIEILAKKGNGNFAYLDDIREAEKVLVTEFTQTLYSVASDVFLSMEFNPQLTNEYRLIGYDNKKTLFAEKDEELEGGEIGSGAGNTILFEIVPVNKNLLSDSTKILAQLSLHYRLPDDPSEQIKNYPIISNYKSFEKIDSSLRFATAVAMFGLKIRQSKYFPEVEWNTIKNLAVSSSNQEDYLQKEFTELVDKAGEIYSEKKRKWWKK